jgi:DNA-binding PadR family transcriptional regulator
MREEFASVPRAQFYVEPERLKGLGLLTEQREPEGCRRRRYSVTSAGEVALREWLISDARAPVQLRDAGLLKLFFAQEMPHADVSALARAQEATDRARLAEYERIAARLVSAPRAAFSLATLRYAWVYATSKHRSRSGLRLLPTHRRSRDQPQRLQRHRYEGVS